MRTITKTRTNSVTILAKKSKLLSVSMQFLAVSRQLDDGTCSGKASCCVKDKTLLLYMAFCKSMNALVDDSMSMLSIRSLPNASTPSPCSRWWLLAIADADLTTTNAKSDGYCHRKYHTSLIEPFSFEIQVILFLLYIFYFKMLLALWGRGGGMLLFV